MMASNERRERAHSRTAGFFQVMGAVFASFFGVRKRASGERDIGTIKPVHVIVAGILGAAILVTLIATLVHFITRGS
jgi:preprotein translocase subunit Sec61beta